MSRRELVQFICKSLSLFLFAYAALISVNAMIVIVCMFFLEPFNNWTDWTEASISAIALIPTAAAVGIGVLYWKKSERIAELMAPDDPAPVANLPLTLQDVMLVAFSICGIFILLHGVKEIVSMLFLLNAYGGDDSQIWESPRTWSALIELGFGLWLLLGSHGIVQAIRWLRTAGHYELNEEASQTD